MRVDIHKPTKSLLLDVDDPFFFRDLIPESKTLDHKDYNVAIRDAPAARQLLKNIGFEFPAKFSGKFQPLPHQLDMIEFYTKHRRCYNLSEMGAMKTAPTLWAADKLMKAGTVRKCVIIAPLSTLERVWVQEIFDCIMHRTYVVVHGGRTEREAAVKMDVDFYILNHDGVLRPDVYRFLMAKQELDLVVVDEGGMLRNAQTDRYKALKKVIRDEQRVWWITGTPVPNAPTDAWAQARIVTPHTVPPYFGQFQRQTMIRGTNFKWKPKIGSDQIAFNALQPAIRFLKKDCISLPPVVRIDLSARLSQEQQAAFHEMQRHAVMEMAGKTITAVNAADKINKLRQIFCGSLRVDDGYEAIGHAPRVRTLRDAIQSASAKVLIIVPFKGALEALAKELRQGTRSDPAYTVGILNGDVSITNRNKIISSFKTTPDPHVLICHPKVMAHGLNLTEADTLIYYAPIYSNDETQQVDERINRAGQTRKMTIVRIGAHPLEWQIYRDVGMKRLNQESVLSLYEALTRGTLTSHKR